ncbi:MAG: Ig-like domain-containing protein [Gemmatimonadales bacterium]|nr:Ig-like domain-containing protein [Gemmatimonadales bacterium]
MPSSRWYRPEPRPRRLWNSALACWSCLLAGGALLISCSGGTEPSPVASVRLTPADGLSAQPGDTVRVQAEVLDAQGEAVDGVTVVWHTSAEAVATVNPSGLVTAIGQGSATVTASAQGVAAILGVQVGTGISAVAVTPSTETLVVGQNAQLEAAARNASGDALPGAAVVWLSSDTLIAGVSSSGLVMAVGPGNAIITASADGRTGQAQIHVVPAVASVQIESASEQLFTGDSVRLNAVLRDSDGTVIENRNITWSSSDSAVVSVSTAGVVKALSAGAANVTALANGASFAVRVVVRRHVAAVSVAPSTLVLRSGEADTVVATLRDDLGNELSDRSIAWVSSDQSVLAVSSAGIVTAIRAGTAIVTASVEGRSAQSAVTVLAPVARVVLSSATGDLTVGGQVQVTAVLTDSDGNVLTGRAVAWETRDPFVASVTREGRVTSLFEGTTLVEARSEGVEGELAIRVAARADSVATLVGAGDIGTCSGDGDEATAKLLDQIPGVVFAAGDNVYNDGTAEEFANCYGPTWGRHKARTRPVAGNHEYNTPNATGYFDYFGPAAGDPTTGYYSYELGAWHVVVLNSNISSKIGSAQATWLAADLDAHPAACTVAMWHHPLFSTDSGSNRTRDAWQLLYDHGAEIVLSGHQHNYQRYAPQTAAGQVDPAAGIREFVVGTGGRSIGGATRTPIGNNEVYYTGGFGVLKLTLQPNSYAWEFVSEAGKTFGDSGETSCH